MTITDELPQSWTCFHCGETFTDSDCAREHFGGSLYDLTACQLNSQDGGLLTALRVAGEQLARYREEGSDTERRMNNMAANFSRDLAREEEKGYAKGLAGARKEAAEALQLQPDTGQQIWEEARGLVEEMRYDADANAHSPDYHISQQVAWAFDELVLRRVVGRFDARIATLPPQQPPSQPTEFFGVDPAHSPDTSATVEGHSEDGKLSVESVELSGGDDASGTFADGVRAAQNAIKARIQEWGIRNALTERIISDLDQLLAGRTKS